MYLRMLPLTEVCDTMAVLHGNIPPSILEVLTVWFKALEQDLGCAWCFGVVFILFLLGLSLT